MNAGSADGFGFDCSLIDCFGSFGCVTWRVLVYLVLLLICIEFDLLDCVCLLVLDCGCCLCCLVTVVFGLVMLYLLVYLICLWFVLG